MTIDLDALEKLADEAQKAVERIEGGDGWNLTHQGPDEFYGTYREIGAAKFFGSASEEQSAFAETASPATIKALIAELKEERELFSALIFEVFDAITSDGEAQDCKAEELADLVEMARHAYRAFLARNGKGEG